MTQSIVVQVGQCGNQIGCRFWDLALREHATVNKSGAYDEPLSSFFRNVDSRYDDPADIPVGDGKGKVKSLKARAVLVDMEEGVVSEMTKGPLREVFDFRQLLTDVSGCGNNWAVGHKMYGVQYRDKLSETIRHAAEYCDCLQCFFVIHSMGGGRGLGPSFTKRSRATMIVHALTYQCHSAKITLEMGPAGPVFKVIFVLRQS